MTLTLTLNLEKENRLAVQARRAGLSLDDYVQSILDQAVETPTPSLTPEERIARFEAWADSHGPDTPILTDEAISQEAIYSRD